MYHSSNLQMYGILREILLGDRSFIGTYVQILLIHTTFSFGNRFNPIYKKLHLICGWIIVLMRSVAVYSLLSKRYSSRKNFPVSVFLCTDSFYEFQVFQRL